MSKFVFDNSLHSGVTIISNSFLSRFLADAPSDYIKVYLGALSYAQSDFDGELGIDGLAKVLGLEKDVVHSAWEYWESQEQIALLPYITEQGESDYIIRFTPEKAPEKLPEKPEPRKAATPGQRLASSMGDENVRAMFDYIKALLGRELGQTELLTFLDWIEEYHFPTELATMLVALCAERGKTELNYMKKIASQWHKEGIDTLEKAEAQQHRHKEKWQKYSRVMGFFRLNRQPSETEEAYLEKWFYEFGMEDEVIMKACEQTVKTLKPSFDYVNTILTKWRDAGVRTVSDLEEYIRKQDVRPAAGSGMKPRTTPQQKPQQNFSSRTYDTAALREKLIKKGRGEI